MVAMVIAATLIFLVFAPFIAWPQQTKGYTFHRTGYPKSIDTHVVGINDHPDRRGDLVGHYTDRDFNNPLPFVQFGRSWHDVGIDGVSIGHVNAINNHRVIAGTSTPDPESGAWLEGFMYGGEHLEIIRFPGADYTEIWGVNDAGTAVGTHNSRHGSQESRRMFIYDQGAFTELPPVDGHDAWATDINNHGDVVGTVYATATGATHGFIFADGQYEFFAFPNGAYGTVSGINDHGHIVGSFMSYEYDYDDGASNCCWRGFLLKDGAYTVINFKKDAQTAPAGINNRGIIAGTHYRPYDGWLAHGFYAVPKPPPPPKKVAKK